jgi:hypothetical protein
MGYLHDDGGGGGGDGDAPWPSLLIRDA